MRTSQSLLVTTAMLVVAFWVGSLITRSGKFTIDPTMLVIFPALMLFTQIEQSGRNLQSTFLLPLRRDQIVFRYGAALLLLLFEEWLAFAIALVIVDWMPIPGKIGTFPSMAPILISLASQLPMFGIVTLSIGRSRLSIVVLVILGGLPLAVAGVQLSVIAILISGPALIWFSYRHWCRAEAGAS